MPKLLNHPFCSIWPTISDPAAMRRLSDDIKTNGLLDSITIFEGKILDGKNRYEACHFLGIEPEFSQFKGTQFEALAFCYSKNAARRHSTIEEQVESLDKFTKHFNKGALSSGDHEGGLMDSSESIRESNSKTLHSCRASDIAEENEANGGGGVTPPPPPPPLSPSKAAKVLGTSATVIKDARRRIRKKEAAAKENFVDYTGFDVPQELRPLWVRRYEIEDIRKALAHFETVYSEAKQEKDLLWSIVGQEFQNAVKSAHQALSASRVYCVCPTCEGKNYRKCNHCRGRGFLNPGNWKACPPEVKAKRQQ